MRKLLLSIVLLSSVVNLQAQSISHIETTKNCYYIYNANGKKTKTLSESTVGKSVFSLTSKSFGVFLFMRLHFSSLA